MKKALILLSTVLLVLTACDRMPGAKKENNVRENIAVRAKQPEVRDIDRSVSFSGRLEGIRDVMVFPQVPGTIDRIYVKSGDRVGKGKLLVRMDDESLNQTEAQFEAAKQTYERMRRLYEDSLIAPQQFDQAKAQYEAARAGYNRVLDNTELRAPFSGLIVGKYFDEHDVYSPGIRGILRLAKTETLKLPVNISSGDYAQLEEGMTAEVEVETYEDTTFRGELVNISPGADPMTGLFSGEIVMENADGFLPVGVFVDARVSVEVHEDALVVPRSALVSDSLVFVYSGGRVGKRSVRTGITKPEVVEIASGIQVGDSIVYSGALGLRDGAEVDLIEEVSK